MPEDSNNKIQFAKILYTIRFALDFSKILFCIVVFTTSLLVFYTDWVNSMLLWHIQQHVFCLVVGHMFSFQYYFPLRYNFFLRFVKCIKSKNLTYLLKQKLLAFGIYLLSNNWFVFLWNKQLPYSILLWHRSICGTFVSRY